ncbi:MAG: GntR family transcriptional regulator [Pseudomonadota bacterium]
MTHAETLFLTVPPQNPAEAKVPAHEQVYRQIRIMILFGALAPGQAVTIQGLIDSLGAGMTPVREALRRLISEGALTHQGNRRVRVPLLSADCLQELSFMRGSLEPELARRACLRITGAEIDALTACDDTLNTAIDAGDIGGYLTENYRFHATLYAIAEAPIMAATVDRLWLRFGPSLRVVCGRFGTRNLPDKHQELLAALRLNNADHAAHAMAEDVAQGMVQIKAALSDP